MASIVPKTDKDETKDKRKPLHPAPDQRLVTDCLELLQDDATVTVRLFRDIPKPGSNGEAFAEKYKLKGTFEEDVAKLRDSSQYYNYVKLTPSSDTLLWQAWKYFGGEWTFMMKNSSMTESAMLATLPPPDAPPAVLPKTDKE